MSVSSGASWPDLPVHVLRGAGPQRVGLLEKLSIRTVGDLVLHAPRSYIDRTRITPLREVTDGATFTVLARVISVSVRRYRGTPGDVIASLEDESGRARAIWFHQPFMKNALRLGDRVLVHGKVRLWRGMQFANPDFEAWGEESAGSVPSGGGVVPVYPLTAGLSQKILRGLIRRALDSMPADANDPLPAAIRNRVGLLRRSEALRSLHAPASLEEAEAARRRLAFEELFFLQLLLMRVRQARRRLAPGRVLVGGDALLARARQALPFRLTAAQEQALDAILRDLAASSPANRLLQGDVGSGKTVVAALAIAWTAGAGCQSCVMAPTEILAEQHARTLNAILEGAGLHADLLVGRTPPTQRRRILRSLGTGELDLIVGTHALLEEDVRFRDLGLIVVDEQHRFGVMQRLRIREKGARPHMLVMSATPIPRTLALACYGDLDVTTMDELPPGRTPVCTRVVGRERWDDLLGFVAKRLRCGQQAFFVYPLVEGSELLDLRDATRMRKEIAAHPSFQGLTVGLLHGRTGSEERERILAAMRSGTLHALVSTTVVEVGLDMPRATIMVVEHPERFGLSQLHQLRGRIGRAPGETPYCFLVRPKAVGPDGLERLRVLARTRDGFRIAEEDLRLRGPGELVGIRQAGIPQTRLVDLMRDGPLLREARSAAEAILGQDPEMAGPDSRILWDEVMRAHPEALGIMETA